MICQSGMRPAAEWTALVEAHVDIVGRVVAQVAYRFPRHVDRQELWNAGALGLVEAARRYDPAYEVPFDRYAAVRIRGAVIDATRTRDLVSRSIRRGLREMEDAQATFAATRGRDPEPPELAAVLGITKEDLAERRRQAASSVVLYLDHRSGDDQGADDRLLVDDAERRPDEMLSQRELVGAMREAVRELPGTHGEVVRRYYLDGETLRTIAVDLGVTEARVSQIRSEGLVALRAYFNTLYEGVPEVPDDSPGKRMRDAFVAQLTSQSCWRSRIESAEDWPRTAGVT